MAALPFSVLKPLRGLMMLGLAAAVLAGCAVKQPTGSVRAPDFSGMSRIETQTALDQLAARYKANPKDRTATIYYAAALRASGQPGQATAVLETGMAGFPGDVDIATAYAKALTASGSFEQALNVIDNAIDPTMPNWNALSVKGAILDQMGRNTEARQMYLQAMTVAPGEASLYANLGLSYAMTNELAQAEVELRKAVQMRGATSQIRQNLALVVGLQGRFDECRALFAVELSPDQVEANMAYIRALLTQQDRWELIKNS